MNMESNLLAICGMGAATYATRLTGPILARRLPKGGKTEAFLRALPGAILTALVAPTVLTQGVAETAASVAALAAAFRFGMLGALVAGVGVVFLLRQWGL